MLNMNSNRMMWSTNKWPPSAKTLSFTNWRTQKCIKSQIQETIPVPKFCSLTI